MKLPSFLVAFAVIASVPSSLAFSPNSHISLTNAATSTSAPAITTITSLQMSESEAEDQAPKASRLGGNSRKPTIQEISVMDDMITKLIQAKPYELPNAVSKAIRVVSSPQFFMRIAERADIATNEVEKEQLSNLATNLITTIEAVVSTAEDKLEDRAKLVEKVVKSASEPDSGEFLVPLSDDRLADMRKMMDSVDFSDLDEGFLSTVDAWMNKSHEDGLDGMVAILQKVLQMYAGKAILRAKVELQANVGAALSGNSQAKADEVAAEEEAGEQKPAGLLLDKLLNMDTELWDVEIKSAFSAEDGVAPKSLIGETQRIIEAVILGLENGSMAQRVQAEYLKELITRIEAIEKQM
jgi:hypothetical protein